MGILSAIINGVAERRASLANPDTWLEQAFGGVQTYSGVSVDESKALTLSAVYACVRVLSETLASLPLPVYRRLDPRGKERVPTHSLYPILHDRPNPEMTAFTFKETMMSHVILWGNAFAEIELDRANRPIALWPLLPDRTWVERKDRVLRYKTRVGGQEFTLPPGRVLHVPGLSFDGLRGYSPIALHRQAVGLGLATEEYGARFFGSGAHAGGVLEYDGEFENQDARDDFRKQFGAVHEGLGNSHRTAVLPRGMKWTQTSIPPDDAQYLGTRGFQVREIARIFRVPPHLIADLDNATFSNIEQQSLEFVIYTLRPWLVRFEQVFNHSLIPARERAEVFVEFLIEGLLRGDIASRFTAYATGRMNGWLSANDIRELENQNPLPGDQGNIYMVPLNMVPADSFIQDDGLTAGAPESNIRPAMAARNEARSTASRRRAQKAHVPLLGKAAQGVIRGEVQAVARAVKQAYGPAGGGNREFTEWLDEFYRGHEATITRRMLPVLTTLAEAINAEANAEIGADEEMTPEMEDFVRSYAESLAGRMATSSSGQLRQLVVEAEPEQVPEAVTQRLGEWEETRPGKVAARESVQAGSAIAKAAWAAGGIRRLVWRASAGHCPICEEMDGRTVEITRTFLSPGQGVNPEGDTAPLEATQSFGHPPLHEGCNCSIEPA